MNYRSKLYPHYYNPLLIKPTRPLPKEAAIVGSGTIGPDIGYYLKNALPDMILTIVDIKESALHDAQTRIQTYVDKAIRKRKMNERQGKMLLENISFTTDYAALEKCDLVIEATHEDPRIKKAVISQIEEIVSPETIITSTTSSIPAERIFSDLKYPERATISHFFAPAWHNPVVEVVTWGKVEREIVDYLRWMFCMTGKMPIVSDNAICFILNRVFVNWCNEAAYLLEAATAGEIDRVAEDLVFAGPFYVLNMTKGNHLIVEINNRMMDEGEHYRPSILFKSVDHWNTIGLGKALHVPQETAGLVRGRLLGVLFSQCFDIINQGIGIPEDLNTGCQLALGFRKGPFDIMRELGEEATSSIIRQFQKDRPGFPGPERPISYYENFKRHVLVDMVDGVEIITIRRPQYLNAVNDEVNKEILAVLTEDHHKPDVKGFILTGYGHQAFCAGAEIGKFPEVLGDYDAALQFARDWSELFRFIDQMEKPVVAAVNGMALGGGFELAIRCHRIVATENAHFQFPEITLGILPGVGGCVVPYTKWPAAAKLFHDMIRFGKRLKVEEAAELGIVKVAADYHDMIRMAIEKVHRLQGNIFRTPDGVAHIERIPEVDAPMSGILPLSREAVAIVDQTITAAAAASTFQEALEIGYHGFAKIACTAAAREGITAFEEKRKPNFTR